MAQQLLLKLPFTRKGSARAVSSPGKSSSAAAISSSPDPPVSSAPISPPSPTVEPRYSAPPMPYVVLSPASARPASTRSRRPVNLFKKLLGKQNSLSNLTVYRSRPDNFWKELRLGFHAGTAAEHGESNTELETSQKLHWDYARTV